MIEPISSSVYRDPWTAYQPGIDATNSTRCESQPSTKAAEEEVVSLWYLTSLQSLQASASHPSSGQSSVEGAVKLEPSTFQKFKTWLYGLFGKSQVSQETPSIKGSPAVPPASVPPSPELQAPEMMNKERLSKAIAELNKELLDRCKNTAEFEEEMQKSNSKKMDRLILFHIIAKSLSQKKLKEDASLETHEEILRLQKKNKDIQNKYYIISKEVIDTAKAHAVLHWVNIGTTVGIVGVLAVGFATGGAGLLYSLALTSLNLTKGGLTTAEGVLKYKNDLRSGEITMITQESKANRSNIHDKVSADLPFAEEEVSNLLKTIRHHLENYNKEARFVR